MALRPVYHASFSVCQDTIRMTLTACLNFRHWISSQPSSFVVNIRQCTCVHCGFLFRTRQKHEGKSVLSSINLVTTQQKETSLKKILSFECHKKGKKLLFFWAEGRVVKTEQLGEQGTACGDEKFEGRWNREWDSTGMEGNSYITWEVANVERSLVGVEMADASNTFSYTRTMNTGVQVVHRLKLSVE